MKSTPETLLRLNKIRAFIANISFSVFGQNLYIRAEIDRKYGQRLYIQVFYHAPCTKTGAIDEWHGAKHYLSDYMTEDEIVKRAYKACEDAVIHEIMEGFKFNDVIVFNPHVNFRKLLEVSPHEVNRDITPPFDI